MPISSSHAISCIADLGVAIPQLHPPHFMYLAQIDPSKTTPFSELLAYQASGLLLVLGCLTILWILTELLSRAFGNMPRDAKRKLAPPAEQFAQAASGGSDNSIEPHVAAIVAAAVATVIGTESRIVRVRSAPAQTVNPQLAAWTIQGRLQHHSSHRIR